MYYKLVVPRSLAPGAPHKSFSYTSYALAFLILYVSSGWSLLQVMCFVSVTEVSVLSGASLL